MNAWWRTFGCLLALLAFADSTISEKEARSLIRRYLEEGVDDAVDYYEYDLRNFSLRFDRCQYVKMYDDEMAEDEESDSPLAVKHFAVFRLCPSDDCASCSGVFGRYVTEVEDYLKYIVEDQQKAFEYMCKTCEEECNNDDAADENADDADAGDDNAAGDDAVSSKCSECQQLCYQYENLEENGYVDAADFIECQALDMGNGDDGENQNAEGGDDDGGQLQLYIGPRCSKDGSRVLIGLFTDEDCHDPYTDAKPEDFLGYNISYHLLKHTSSDDGSNCISCAETNEDGNANDQNDADQVSETCEGLYSDSAKCESKYGLTGFIQENRDDGDYENQVENEFMVCNFIESLIWDSYTETGDINLDGDLDVIIRQMTKLQKLAVSFLSFSIVCLLGAAYILQRQIDNSYPKLDLHCQSDAQLT